MMMSCLLWVCCKRFANHFINSSHSLPSWVLLLFIITCNLYIQYFPSRFVADVSLLDLIGFIVIKISIEYLKNGAIAKKGKFHDEGKWLCKEEYKEWKQSSNLPLIANYSNRWRRRRSCNLGGEMQILSECLLFSLTGGRGSIDLRSSSSFNILLWFYY